MTETTVRSRKEGSGVYAQSNFGDDAKGGRKCYTP